MATLSDTINANKNKVLTRDASGQLAQQTQEETQNLAGQVGLQAPPITPAGVGMIGGNADQQKMAGTPQQKQAALSLASNIPVQNTVEGAVRQAQVRSQATQQEQQNQQKSKDMQDLGQLGDRVSDFIDAQRQKLEAQSQSGQGVAVAAQTQFQGKDVSGIKDLLGQLRQNPNDMNVMLQVNQALGYDVKTQLSPDQINNLYQSSVDALSQGGASTVDDKLSVDDLLNSGKLGYDKQQIADLLEVPVDQVGAMSVGQMKDAINKVSQTEFSKSSTLQQQATSVNLGQAEHGLAQQFGQEASRVGTRASEADVQSLDNQIANADQVTFGGKSYKVDDLLKDDTVSGIISDYLNSAPGSDARTQLEKTEPQLIDFINKNQAILTDAAQQLSTGAQGFKDIQSYNQSLATVGGVTLSDSVAGKLIPGWGQLQAQKVDPNSVPVLKFAQEVPQQEATQAFNELNTRTSDHPDEIQQVQALSDQELDGLFKNNASNWNNYKAASDARDVVANLSTSNPDDFLSSILYNAGGADKVNAEMQQAQAMNVLGLGSGFKVPSYLDPNHDGKLDSASTIKATLLDQLGNPNLKQAASGHQFDVFQKQNIGQIAPMDSAENSLYNSLKSYAADGQVSADDIHKAGLSDDDLYTLWGNRSKGGNVDYGAVKAEVLKREDAKASDAVDSADSKASSNVNAAIDSLKDALDKNANRITEGPIKDRIDAYQTLEKYGFNNTDKWAINYKTGTQWGYTPNDLQDALKTLGIRK